MCNCDECAIHFSFCTELKTGENGIQYKMQRICASREREREKFELKANVTS